ncbi:complement factor D isoform X4 [Mus pahari]|uniref:complement factor D isoform X4 n=1 Tax=Mus pahari TaxID=10093 RepID=UPI001114785D|nr:complement factor D isoform X4 [Mus pahari]
MCTAPRPDSGWPGGRGPCSALHGFCASERHTHVWWHPAGRAVGAQRRALHGWSVLLGAHSLSAPEPYKRLYDVQSIVPHPGSRPDSVEDDLILFKLSQNASLGPHVRPLPLQHEDKEVEPGTLCDVAGWGVVTHAGRRPDVLQQLTVSIMDRMTCNLRTYHDGAVTINMMCAESNRRDTCRGDSGSPLVCGDVVEGVVTWGSRVCGNRRKPGVFTRVATYETWLKTVLNGNVTA